MFNWHIHRRSQFQQNRTLLLQILQWKKNRTQGKSNDKYLQLWCKLHRLERQIRFIFPQWMGGHKLPPLPRIRTQTLDKRKQWDSRHLHRHQIKAISIYTCLTTKERISLFLRTAKSFWTADYYVLRQWNVRPATVERTSHYSGIYVLRQQNVITGRRKRLNPR